MGRRCVEKCAGESGARAVYIPRCMRNDSSHARSIPRLKRFHLAPGLPPYTGNRIQSLASELARPVCNPLCMARSLSENM